MASNWLLWQLADSAFPAGALAHSSGLEAAVQHGVVRDGASLAEFVRAMLRQQHSGVAVFVERAWHEPDAFALHDADCDLFLNSTVSNRASLAQGQAFLATALSTFVDSGLKERAAAIRKAKSHGHLAPTFGLIGRLLEIERNETLQLFSFVTARGCLSAGVRLGVIGPLEAQRIQATLPQNQAFAEDHERGAEQISPMIDLIQSTQDRLYSRLFQS